MTITSFNVKGLTNPKKVKKIQAWRRNQGFLDALILTELKASRSELEKKLEEIDASLVWFQRTHTQGSGCVALGLHPTKWASKAIDMAIDWNKKRVAIDKMIA